MTALGSVLAAVLAIAGCGDNAPDPTQPRSGSRLKLTWYVYDGGARELERDWYFDAELDARCKATLWSDGRRYCSPAADDAVYVNDTCTRALGRTLVGLPPAPFFATTFRLATDPVPVPSRLFRRGAPALPPPAMWQKRAEGCIPIEVEDTFDYFELGDELALSELVHLRREEPRGTGALAVIDEISDDGLRVPVVLHHRATDSECRAIDRPNADTVECTPEAAPSAAYYSDGACSAPVVAATAAPAFAVRFEVATSCWRSYDVGAEISAPPLYEEVGGGCVETAPPGGRRLFATAAERAMPALARERVASPARIQTIVRVGDDLRVADPLVYDSELGTDCRHDGALYCVPRTEAAVWTKARLTYFGDPQCTMAIDLAFVARGACDPEVRYATDGARYWPLAEPYVAPIYVPSTGDTCSGFAPPAPYVAYSIGAPLDRSAFAQAVTTIDP